MGHCEVQYFGQRNARLATQDPGLWIERDQAIEATSQKHGVSVVQANVAVTPASADRQLRAMGGVVYGKVRGPKKLIDPLFCPRVTSPRFEVGHFTIPRRGE